MYVRMYMHRGDPGFLKFLSSLSKAAHTVTHTHTHTHKMHAQTHMATSAHIHLHMYMYMYVGTYTYVRNYTWQQANRISTYARMYT